MDERKLQIRVGVVVVTAAMIAAMLVLFFGEQRSMFLNEKKTIFLIFPQAPGVSPQTPVRKNGILIGRVTDVELLDEGGVVLTASLDSRYKVARNESPRISTASLLGDAVIEFVPSGRPGASSESIEDQEVIADGVVASNPLKVLVGLEETLGGAIRSIEMAGGEVTLLARNMNTIVGNNQEQFQRVIQKSEQAMDRFRSAMTTVDELVGDPEVRAQLKQSLSGLPRLLADSQATLTEARETLAGFRETSKRANASLANVEKITQPFADRSEQMGAALEDIGSLLQQLATFGEGLNSPDGTLGRLLHDRELYDRLQRTASNLEDASRRLRPILDDTRIMTHKLSTDPRLLGVKGALERRPAGAGVKYGVE